MRMTVTRGSMNLSREGRRPAARQRRAGRGHDPRRQRAGAEAVPRSEAAARRSGSRSRPVRRSRSTSALMRESARLAERYDCQLHTHLCETEDEERFCLEMYGLRPVDLLEETGWMSSRAWLAHGIHFNAEEIARLGRAGVGVCHCAASNMVLASGICRTCELEAAGSPRRARRRRLGLERFLQHDGGGAPRADDRPPALRRRQGDAISTCCAGRPRARRAASAVPTSAGSPSGYEADLALFTLDEPRFSRRARSARGARPLRRPPRRSGDGRRANGASSTACRSGLTSPR